MTFDYRAAAAGLVFWMGLAAWVGGVGAFLFALLALL